MGRFWIPLVIALVALAGATVDNRPPRLPPPMPPSPREFDMAPAFDLSDVPIPALAAGKGVGPAEKPAKRERRLRSAER
jgi:hypothetical protein